MLIENPCTGMIFKAGAGVLRLLRGSLWLLEMILLEKLGLEFAVLCSPLQIGVALFLQEKGTETVGQGCAFAFTDFVALLKTQLLLTSDMKFRIIFF